MKRVAIIVGALMLSCFNTVCIAKYDDLIFVDNIVEMTVLTRHWSDGIERNYTTTDEYEIYYLSELLYKIRMEEANGWLLDSTETMIAIRGGNGEKELMVLEERYNFYCCEPLLEPTWEYGLEGRFNRDDFEYFFNVVDGMVLDKIELDERVYDSESRWFSNEIKYAEENELIPQVNRLCYRLPVTRMDVCEITERFLLNADFRLKTEEINSENVFEDYNRKSATLLREAGIIDGKEDNKFCPYDLITREEMAKVLSNVWHFVNQENTIEVKKSVYKDYDEISDWAKEYVDEMTTMGIFQGDDGENFNPKANMTKEEVIVTLMRLFEM